MYMEDLEAELKSAGYEFQFDYGSYDYSWNETRVYTKDGRVFALEDSGCSCSSYGDYYQDVHEAIGDMVEVTSLPELDVEYSRDSSSHTFADNDSLRAEFRKLGVR